MTNTCAFDYPFFPYRKKSFHKGPDTIYRLGGGWRILGGSLDFWEKKKGGSVVTENPKGGIAENVGRIRRGDHSNLLGK